MIRSFRDTETERIFHGFRSRKLPFEIQETAYRKLVLIHNAATITDLKVPPGNQLQKLQRDREGQWGIRINNQWRICFSWSDGDAYNVEIVDYH